MSGQDPDHLFVSRGGLKLSAALSAFHVHPAGRTCADLGSHIGGFVDCLLQSGASKVYSVDTCYGTLAWKLRKDIRVTVMERTNALHVCLPEPVDLVTIDVGWTAQHRILPAAFRLLKPGGQIITLIKPHYEAERSELDHGVLPDAALDRVLRRVQESLDRLGIVIKKTIQSPLRGQSGNIEVLALTSNS